MRKKKEKCSNPQKLSFYTLLAPKCMQNSLHAHLAHFSSASTNTCTVVHACMIQPQSHFNIKSQQFTSVFFHFCSSLFFCKLLPFWPIYYNCYFYVLLNAASYASLFTTMRQVPLNFFGHFFIFLLFSVFFSFFLYNFSCWPFRLSA